MKGHHVGLAALALIGLALPAAADPIMFTPATPCGCEWVWTDPPPPVPAPPLMVERTAEEYLEDLAHEPPPEAGWWDLWCPPGTPMGRPSGAPPESWPPSGLPLTSPPPALVPVPEPTTLALFGAGLLAVARRCRRG